MSTKHAFAIPLSEKASVISGHGLQLHKVAGKTVLAYLNLCLYNFVMNCKPEELFNFLPIFKALYHSQGAFCNKVVSDIFLP